MSVTYLPPELKESRAPSFASLNNDFSRLRPNKQEPLLRGPRRVVRLCVFALLLPAALITVPLYVRLVLYPPAHYPMMPTDQRLLGRHASSIWCQAQTTHMNGSFNSYMTQGRPDVGPERRTHVMLNQMQMEDDVKEYWGFYLLKGSTVTISSCSRWNGGQLMILRGVENLHRCAWIGEEDSAEDMAEDDDDASNERHKLEELERARGPVIIQASQDYKDPEEALGTEPDTSLPRHLHSEERRQSITELLREAIKMSKSKTEILRILHSEGRKGKYSSKSSKTAALRNTKEASFSNSGSVAADEEPTEHKESHTPQPTKGAQEGSGASRIRAKSNLPKNASRKLKDGSWREFRRRLSNKKRKKKGNPKVENLTEEEPPPASPVSRLRQRRQAEEGEATNGAFEELDTEDVLEVLTETEVNKDAQEELAVGLQVFFPEGLKFERGKFNQTTANDNSREEHVSSYSSSEEALASCEGVILTLPLVPYRNCNFQSTHLNKISYDIPVTGTYYFVFSSDNEVYVNTLFFNLTMERVVYHVNKSEEVCANATDCSVPLAFWSDEQTMVEVPPGAAWDRSYVLDIKCEPRVYLYLALLLLVPLLIMCCAFH